MNGWIGSADCQSESLSVGRKRPPAHTQGAVSSSAKWLTSVPLVALASDHPLVNFADVCVEGPQRFPARNLPTNYLPPSLLSSAGPCNTQDFARLRTCRQG